MKILIVDDEPDLCALYAFLLEEKGHRVFSAHNPGDVIPILEKENIDFVILDDHLPGARGQELLQKIKKRWSHIPVVIISGLVDEDFLARGASEVLTKPFPLERLFQLVDRFTPVHPPSQPQSPATGV
ncbi:MAG: response regulator [bacterium]